MTRNHPELIQILEIFIYSENTGILQFWKEAIQGPFHQSLVAIGPVVSQEKIFM
jgi:uncharacterized protein Usg